MYKQKICIYQGERRKKKHTTVSKLLSQEPAAVRPGRESVSVQVSLGLLLVAAGPAPLTRPSAGGGAGGAAGPLQPSASLSSSGWGFNSIYWFYSKIRCFFPFVCVFCFVLFGTRVLIWIPSNQKEARVTSPSLERKQYESPWKLWRNFTYV